MSQTLSTHPLATRKLGKSPLSVTQLGIGTAPLGDLYQRVPEADARDMLALGYELGVRLFDTAPLYGSGLAAFSVSISFSR